MGVICNDERCYANDEGYCDCAKLHIDGGRCVSQMLDPEHVTVREALEEEVAKLKEENERLRSRYVYAVKVMNACAGELLDQKGVPYIVGPAGPAQALMEATAMAVGKRYDEDPPSFFGGGE